MSKASQLRQRAQGFLQKGKSDKAIEEYKKLVQIEPRNPNLFNELGDIYLRINDRIQAVAAFENATTNYEQVALYNNAVAVCKKILRVIPNRLDTIYKLGEIKAKQKFNGEAESYFLQYFEAILADPESSADQAEERVERILTFLPGCDAITAKASDVYEHIGLKKKAAKVLAEYISKNSIAGDPQRLNYYRNKLDLLKQSLNKLDIETIEGILAAGAAKAEAEAGAAATCDPGAADEDAQSQAGEASGTPAQEKGAGVDSQGIKLTDYASSLGGRPEKTVEEKAAVEAAGETDGPDRSVSDKPDETAEDQLVETDDATAGEPDAGMPGQEDGSVDAEAAEEVGPTEEFVIEEPAEAARPAEQAVKGDISEEKAADGVQDVDKEHQTEGAAESCGSAAVEDEDLSDLLDKEDARSEDESSPRNLAEEITSDVEENDYRSHYDLGMAYIEMGLYNDAIKELQISSRSDNLQLQSLEMIGLCFLSLDNPRLAVKQLERGLAVARHTGGDSLGIHYNLGLAYEALSEIDKAREHFEEVYIVDVTFRDISEKMKKFSTVP